MQSLLKGVWLSDICVPHGRVSVPMAMNSFTGCAGYNNAVGKGAGIRNNIEHKTQWDTDLLEHKKDPKIWNPDVGAEGP